MSTTELLASIARGYVRFVPGNLGKARIVDQYLNAALRNTPVTRDIVLRNGVRMSVDTKDIVQRYLYQFGIWEPSLSGWLARTLRPGDVFVDVGANIGYYSLLAARLVGHLGSVVAIEASPPPTPRFAATSRPTRPATCDWSTALSPRTSAP